MYPPIRSQSNLVLPDFHALNQQNQQLQAQRTQQPQRTRQTRMTDPYANLRGVPLHTLPAPTRDFWGRPVPQDLAAGFKPDSINQYHEFLKAVLYGHPDTARSIKASRNPDDWKYLGRYGVCSFEPQHWHDTGRDWVVQFASKAIQDSQHRRATSAQKTHRPAMQNKLLGKLAQMLHLPRGRGPRGKVHPGGGSSPGVKLSAKTTHHYPQHNSSEKPYAPRWLGGSFRANQQVRFWKNGQVYHDAQTANIDPARLKAMATRSMPLGFANEWQFKQFKRELSQALRQDGIQDSMVGLNGTSATFYSDNRGTAVSYHFDSNGPKTSDLDLYIRGPKVLQTLKGACVTKDGVYSNRDVKTAFPNLGALSSRWKNVLGRDVNIVAKPFAYIGPPVDPASWTLHSPT
jgi:hypothetical protein